VIRKKLFILCIIFVSLLCIPFVFTQKSTHGSELFKDEFDSKSLDKSWLIIRENQSEWSLTANPGYLRISTQTENLWQINVNNKIKFLRRGPHGDFEATTKLIFNPKEKFQQAGIIIYQDEENYVMLTRQKDDVQNVKMSWAIAKAEGEKRAATSLTTLYLKLTKSGSSISAAFSSNGDTWINVGQISGLHFVKPQIGLVGYNAQLNTTVDADVDFFAIKKGEEEEGLASAMEELLDVNKYNKSIHVMAMLMVGFGFLMVFVRRYGWGSVTATYIAVSFVIPYYMFLKTQGVFGEAAEFKIDRFILAEFCAASMLIAMGAFLGRLKMAQYLIAALLFVPSYLLNEWIMLDNGMGFIPKGELIDTGGSIVIHQFGAYFGLGVIVRMTTRGDYLKEIDTDKISNQFSMLGSMVLWIFWPSFCAAAAEASQMVNAAVNTVLSLCAATIATYITTVLIRKKIGIEDMANAALAGGVAIGSSCAFTNPKAALILGFLAGILSVLGFTIIQPRIQKLIKGVDTCGVHNLHGMPGILGGLAAIFMAKNAIPGLQIKAVIITFVVAVITGLASGTIVSLFGHRKDSYNDAEEFNEVREVLLEEETH